MKTMTFGIKKAAIAATGKPLLFTDKNEWQSAKFVGIGASDAAKEWKTQAGAERASLRWGGEVFTISDGKMNYNSTL